MAMHFAVPAGTPGRDKMLQSGRERERLSRAPLESDSGAVIDGDRRGHPELDGKYPPGPPRFYRCLAAAAVRVNTMGAASQRGSGHLPHSSNHPHRMMRPAQQVWRRNPGFFRRLGDARLAEPAWNLGRSR